MLGADVPLPRVTRLVTGQDNDFTRALCELLQHAPRIAARHSHRNPSIDRCQSASRLLGAGSALDGLPYRLDIDAERRQHAGRLVIVSHRCEIAETELRPTITEGGRQQPPAATG
jgi:hypothetical protein